MGIRIVPGRQTQRRTDRVLDAIDQEVEKYRAFVDTQDAIRSISIIVKLVKGTPYPRTVIVQMELEETNGNGDVRG
jgi:hypothetical protein